MRALAAMSRLLVLIAAASCCFERGALRRSARDGRSASASPISRFGAALTFRDFADVERMTVPEIVIGEKFWSSRPVYIFVNAVRAPHPLGEESGFGGWGATNNHCIL